MQDDIAEFWEQRREPRSFFGNIVKWSFVLFNGLMAIEIAWVLERISEARETAGNGLAKAMVGQAGQSVLFEWFALWIVGAVLLGGLMLATRGKSVMVRRVVASEKA